MPSLIPAQSAQLIPEGSFEHHFLAAFQGVRGALTELLGSVGADPSAPQGMARQFGLDKSLAWKLSRVVNATDPFAAVRQLPGSAGIEIVVTKLAQHGASERAVDAVRAAVQEFERMIEVHAGDRRSFDLMLASLSQHQAPQEQVEESRRMAFEGNSAIWGIQARVRFACSVITPSAGGGGLLDVAVVGGLIDVRRLRPDVGVPLYITYGYNDDGSVRSVPNRLAVDPRTSGDDPLKLIPEFCSPNLPPLEPIGIPGGARFELPSGPVGNSGLMSLVYGWCDRRFASMYRDAANTYGEHTVRVLVPSETLIADLLIHHSLDFAHHPEAALYGMLAEATYSPTGRRDRDRLPLIERAYSIGARPPTVATPQIPRYPDMIARVCERMQLDLREFVGVRFMVKYPPIPTTAMLRFELPERPG